jgi:hypothetical protein
MNVTGNKDYAEYGRCSMSINHKHTAVLRRKGRHRKYALSICRDFYENTHQI